MLPGSHSYSGHGSGDGADERTGAGTASSPAAPGYAGDHDVRISRRSDGPARFNAVGTDAAQALSAQAAPQRDRGSAGESAIGKDRCQSVRAFITGIKFSGEVRNCGRLRNPLRIAGTICFALALIILLATLSLTYQD